MLICPVCKKRLSQSGQCPHCRPKEERKIPIVTAIIAMVFFAVLVFGAASVIIGRVRSSGAGDTALHLDGLWVTQGATYNYDSVSFEFSGDGFINVSERVLFSDSPDDLTLAREFYETYYGAAVDAVDTGYGSYQLRITASGIYVLDGNSILLIAEDNVMRRLPFYWDGDEIVIYPDRFVRVI